MSRLRFFTDEDVYGSIPPALRRAGYDAIGTIEAGRSGESDESQLTWAAREGRVVVTFNVAHFAALHRDWSAQGRRHTGIIVSSQRPIGDLLRRLLRIAAGRTAESMLDQIVFLSEW